MYKLKKEEIFYVENQCFNTAAQTTTWTTHFSVFSHLYTSPLLFQQSFWNMWQETETPGHQLLHLTFEEQHWAKNFVLILGICFPPAPTSKFAAEYGLNFMFSF